MIPRRPPSLLRRLALRIGIVMLVTLGVLIGLLTYRTLATTGTLEDASLQIQSDQIIRSLSVDPDEGVLRLELPARIAAAYARSRGALLYLVRRPDGRPVFSSGPAADSTLGEIDTAISSRGVFRVPIGDQAPYVAQAVHIGRPQPLEVLVAQGRLHADVIVDSLMNEFALEIGWMMVGGFGLLMGIVLWTLRSGLSGLDRLSAEAREIGPTTTARRLPLDGVPREVAPLVHAVNQALDRLGAGFEMQRRFTADAAHELRTPLAILTARLDGLPAGPERAQFMLDVRRMNRLIDQLLSVARLDATPLDVSERFDLAELAADLVGYMAPVAIRQGRSLALERASGPAARVRGNRGALEDAVRNLVENALAHTPPGTEVTVGVAAGTAEATLTVRDRGPGVAPEHRRNVFRRFWRGGGIREAGAGLGLAIVDTTVRAHGGRIEVTEAEGGGALFLVSLPVDRP